jgi:hypothetical protein
MLEAVFSGRKLELICFSVGCAGILLGASQLGVSYTIDGDSRTITKRRTIVMWHRPATDFDSVLVSVGHDGPKEIIVLSLVPTAGKHLVLERTLSDDRGLPLIAAGERIAELLDLPLVRYGTPVQGSSTVDALNNAQPKPGTGDGRDLLINCPKCGTLNAKAVAYDLVETLNVVIRHRTTWVKCLSCGAKLYSRKRAEELIGLSAAELEKTLVARVSLINKMFAVMALACAVVPVFGTVVGVIAIAINYRRGGWLKWCSLVALILSFITTTLILLPIQGK